MSLYINDEWPDKYPGQKLFLGCTVCDQPVKLTPDSSNPGDMCLPCFEAQKDAGEGD